MLSFPHTVLETLFQDAMERDITTRRRAALLGILWNERYLTRAQLMARVEVRMGKGCFGAAAWEDTFFRDMRVVRQAFDTAELILKYSRSKGKPGYYVKGQGALSAEYRRMIRASAGEVDDLQINIYRKLTPADRFRQGCAISDLARRVVAGRIKQENPDLTLQEAHKLALQRAYAA